MDTLVHGFQFNNPNNTYNHESVGIGFVDDGTLGCTEKRDNTPTGTSIIEDIKVSTKG